MNDRSGPAPGLLRSGWRYLKQRWRQARPYRPTLTDEWDQEWIGYFNSEDPRPFFKPYTSLTVAADCSTLGPREVLATALCPEMGMPLHVYMPGNRLCGGRVFEVGCGPGLLCKQIGLIAAQVVGIDYSKLALHVARLVSPPTVRYYHTSEVRQLRWHYGTFDCMVCRNFFIHQNYARAVQVLGLARRLLRQGGLVGADFYLTGRVPKETSIFPARSPLARNAPSCAYVFSQQEVGELAAATGFRVLETWEQPVHLRRFTLLERTA